MPYTITNLYVPDSDRTKHPRFQNPDLQEGVSLREPIDTRFENFSIDEVDNPRSAGGNESHEVESWKFPHRVVG